MYCIYTETVQESEATINAIELKDNIDDNIPGNEQIEQLKRTVRKCLNLGEDHSLFFSSTPLKLPISSFLNNSNNNNNNEMPAIMTSNGSNTQDIDIHPSLNRLQLCEDLISIMESNIYQCPTQASMLKWDNRFKAHKIRISNFRKLLNQILQMRIKSIEDDKQTLMSQLEQARVLTPNHSDRDELFQSLGNLHSANLSSLMHSTVGKRKKRGRKSSILQRNNHQRKYSGVSEFSDTSSVESEVDLVYVPGTSFKGEEAERLLKRIKAQKNEIKKMKKESKIYKSDIKKLTLHLQTQKSQFQKVIRKRDKVKQELLDKQQLTKNSLMKLRANTKTRDTSGNNSEVSSKQRNIIALRKQVKNMQNDIDTKTDMISNLRERLRRMIVNSSKNAGQENSGVSGTVSQRKITRLEGNLNDAKQEIAAKQKKLDDLFLKWKSVQKKLEFALQTKSETQAKYQAHVMRFKKLEKQYNLLEEEQNERSSQRSDLRKSEKRIQILKEKLTRLKSRNKKLCKRIQELLTRLEEYELLNNESQKLMKLLKDLNDEKMAIQLQIAQEKYDNVELRARLHKLQNEIKSKEFEMVQTFEKLDTFQSELSAEYSMIRLLQKQLEEKDLELENINEQKNEEMEYAVSAMENQRVENNDKEEELNIKILRLEAQLEQQIKVNGKYKIRIQNLDGKNDILNDKIIELEEKIIRELQETINELKSLLDEKNEECKLINERNDELQKTCNKYSKIESNMKELAETLDDNMSKNEELQDMRNKLRNDLRLKSQEFDNLLITYKDMKSLNNSNVKKIRKLNITIKDFSVTKLAEDDETKYILKTYKTQIVKIEVKNNLLRFYFILFLFSYFYNL